MSNTLRASQPIAVPPDGTLPLRNLGVNAKLVFVESICSLRNYNTVGLRDVPSLRVREI